MSHDILNLETCFCHTAYIFGKSHEPLRAMIVGGRSRADYLMGALAETVDTVVAINDDRRFCEYLSSRHEGTVIWGDGMRLSVLEDAGVAGFDAIVALTGLDADNLAICQIAKRFLGIRLQLCIVSNPENTAIFRQLGVTAAISATASSHAPRAESPASVGAPATSAAPLAFPIPPVSRETPAAGAAPRFPSPRSPSTSRARARRASSGAVSVEG